MKNFNKIIGISLLAALVLIIGVMAYHSLYGNSQAKDSRAGFQVPGLTKMQGKPATGLKDQRAPVVEPEQELTDDNLMTELQKTVDDDGAQALEDLKKESAGL